MSIEQALAAAEEAERQSLEDQIIPADTAAPYTDNFVDLPVGLLQPGVGLIDTAEVRELNGYDEEVITRAKSAGAAVQQILERALVSVGDRKASKKDLVALTIPDRVEILIAIRAATWGPDIEWNLSCPSCGGTSEVSVSVADIPRKPLADKIAGRSFSLTLPSGAQVQMSWPSGDLHAKTLTGAFSSNAELVTALIVSCVDEFNGLPLLQGEDSARAMSLRDRQAIATYVFDNMPGPALDETTTECPLCGEVASIPLSVGALFPG